jgi:hypothetical protein
MCSALNKTWEVELSVEKNKVASKESAALDLLIGVEGGGGS